MNTVIKNGKGSGYKRRDNKLGMLRCFDCGKENYASSVHSGICAWCGFDANAPVLNIKKGN